MSPLFSELLNIHHQKSHIMTKIPLTPLYPEKNKNKINWGQLHGCSQELLIANTAQEYKGLILLVTPDSHSAYQAQASLHFFSGRDDIHIFPDWETLPYDVFSPHEDLISERLKTLHQLSTTQQGILIVPVATLMHRLAPTDYIHNNTFLINKGDTLDLKLMRLQLEQTGYRHVAQVMEHGEYATRGSLIDLFPMGNNHPIRIDLFDNEVDSIRSFNPEDQLTLKQLDKIELLPAQEFPLNPEGIQTFRTQYAEQLGGDLVRSQIYDNVSNGNPPAGIEYYLPLFFEKTATLFDYLPDKTLLIHSDEIHTTSLAFTQYIAERYEQRSHDIERPLLKPEALYLNNEELQNKFDQLRCIKTHAFKQENLEESHNYPTYVLPSLLLQARAESPLILLRQFMQVHQGRILFTADSAGRRENLLGLLRDHQQLASTSHSWQNFLQGTSRLSVTVAPLNEGLWLKSEAQNSELAIIPEGLIFGQKIQQERRRKRKATRDAEAIISNLTDLHQDAPVVHEEHGIGRYQGMKKLEVAGIEQEFITLEYAKGDKLYVPVSSLHLISRYSGASPEKAPLHKLGTEQWDKIRKKAAKRAHDIAAELLEINARRAALEGHAYQINEIDYLTFSEAFPFEETPDQAKAIEAVKEDLISIRPMDRVVCGDVGFGKTEVAMRATFLATNGGKQVAIIAPTTLLVQQHTQNFRDRFADWPFEIETLSRFRTPKQTREVLAGLKTGQVDIVIGTHKLLSKDVQFKDLGLVIIDEEHRFGVRHKEQLKKLRANVDMLTMTATPIPRTLNMSLSGLRDLSIIATPPAQRHAIKTFVKEWDKALIQEACTRELSRGGQIYVLHNQVKTIQKMTDQLKNYLPNIEVRFAHGQMSEKELESIMKDFYHQRFHVLVATTIIESGIDVPTANTIIINRADKLGLAQLHQLRGRVGRSHHKAYAYLIVPDQKAMTIDAKKRLEAIESLEELGVGFTLASHDLEIRGAGELLGDEQSGQIQEIGFSLYNELLERAVKAIQRGDLPEEDGSETRTTVDLGAPALIPDDYLPDVHQRLIIYKRIANTNDKAELRELRIELIDRFGLLPEALNTLFDVTRLKQIAQTLGILKLDIAQEGGRILFNKKPAIDPMKIMQLVQSNPQQYKIVGSDKLYFEQELESVEQRIQWIKKLFAKIS